MVLENRRVKVELYEQIRREYEHGAGTIRAVARKLGVHRREVRKALASAVPAERKIPERERPRLAAAIPFIDGILESDRQAPRKQRHTAHRIFTRLRRERPEVEVAESTVRRYVRERKAAMGLLGRETFVPQSYAWGGEGQVDWYEGWAEFDGERRKTYQFCMRSMASGGAFHGPEVEVAESTVRRYVRERKAAMGLLGRETFVPQSYAWGGEGQVDWYEGWAEFDGERRKTYQFCMRSMASGGAFHRAYPHANQQAFLEAHELAFAYFGGVFRLWRARHKRNYVKDRIMRRKCGSIHTLAGFGSFLLRIIGGSWNVALLGRHQGGAHDD